jgi:hypothetical protein
MLAPMTMAVLPLRLLMIVCSSRSTPLVVNRDRSIVAAAVRRHVGED